MTERIVNFVIPGRVGGKGRHRTDPRSGRAYTPKQTRSDEGIVRFYAEMAMATTEHNEKPLQGALRLSVTINKLYPKSWSAKRRETTVWVTGKPDASNVLKLIEDGMNGTVYGDDSQIASLVMTRMYGMPECIGITVSELENTP